MIGRTPRLALALALAACKPPTVEPPAPAPAPAPPVEVAPPAPAAPALAESPKCVPTASDPAPPAPPGPAYVLVEHVGLLRIDDGAVSTLWTLPRGTDASSLELAASPGGNVWLSGWRGVEVLSPDGRVRKVRQVRDGPRYEHLIIRADDDVWAVTSDIEWEVVHYDGKRWKPVRKRSQFPGKFSDNKFSGLAVTADGVWVSSWNGLWRGVGDQWQQIEAPDGDDHVKLWAWRDRLIAGDPARPSIRDGDRWRRLAWPHTGNIRRAVSDAGLVAAPEHRQATVTIGSVTGEGCTAISEPADGSYIDEFVMDRAGRTWLATDAALAVVDREGRKLAEWSYGALPGLSGRIRALAVIGAGPQRLPAPQPARTWQVTGVLTTFKSGAPLARAEIELCSAPSSRCPPAALLRKTTSAADGAFRLDDVPAGDFWLHVRPPADNPDCDGVFSVNGHALAPIRDCPPTGPCDLGTLTDCYPFEMPPPPPR